MIEGENYDALPSPTGRLIYYSASVWEERPVRTRHGWWFVVSATDGKRVFDIESPANKTRGVLPTWAPDDSGIDYVVTKDSVSNIWRQPLTGDPARQITHFSSGKIFSFAWSRDGKWLSFASGFNRSDVVLITREP
jgi:Tol biopolymer transport system component